VPATGRPFGCECQAFAKPSVETRTFWAKIQAMSVPGTPPVFFAVAAFQHYLVRGISLGAAKG
jgi:ABC-type glycerol-3-phosphate transport system permease component